MVTARQVFQKATDQLPTNFKPVANQSPNLYWLSLNNLISD